MAQKIESTKQTSNEIYALLYAGFPGIGKSTLYNKFKFRSDMIVLDSDSSTFDKINFPNNYIKHIKDNLNKVSIILISTHEEVRKALVDNGLKFTLVYPNKDLKDEYIERYKKRGNNENFVKLLDKFWNEWIEQLDSQECEQRIRLKSGQYLCDVIPACI